MRKESGNHFAAIIPARYASTRFPGKPLVLLGDKPLIQRVYEQAIKSIELVYVATDDNRILDTVLKFGGKAVLTSSEHQSGTDRCAEAVDMIISETGQKIDIVVNIQGDEPFIHPAQIDLLKSCFNDKTVQIATLIRKTVNGEDIFNPNQPKVILDSEDNAIYFSRAPIPYYRGLEAKEWSKVHTFFKHLGLYAYTTPVLKKITKLARTPLEIAESLEQNRWIENGLKIKTAVTDRESIGIDTPDDLKRALAFLKHFN
jgi:3-deoxy-manno-octulosonate cytidylyltransferase (CMP-KDO synthetase)